MSNVIPGQGYQTKFGYGMPPMVQAGAFKDSKGTKLALTFEQINEYVLDAVQDALNAYALATGKSRVFITTPTPPYEVGDLWASGSTTNIKRCTTERLTGSFSDSDWDYAGAQIVNEQDSYTKVLLNFNGIHASTTFTDEYGKIWTANGNAKLSIVVKKFGYSSAYFDGSGDWIDTPDHDDFTLGSDDFTFDFWAKKDSDATGGYFFGQCNNVGPDYSLSSIMFVLFSGTDPRVYIHAGSTRYTLDSTGNIADSEWHHYAVVRYGNTLTVYVDGVSAGTLDVTGITINNSPHKFSVGRAGELASSYFKGYMDAFRFSKGIARWTANFMPSIYEYVK